MSNICGGMLVSNSENFANQTKNTVLAVSSYPKFRRSPNNSRERTPKV